MCRRSSIARSRAALLGAALCLLVAAPAAAAPAFTQASQPAVGTQPTQSAIGDLNGDGKADVVTSDYGSAAVSVLLGNGDGTFAGHVEYATGTNTKSVAIADLNNDGDLDVATANWGGSVSVLKGNGDGTLQAKTDYALPGNGTSIVVADMNGDTEPDLVASTYGAKTVSVLLNDGSGVFTAHNTTLTGNHTLNGVAVGDVDEDGKPDVVVSDEFLGGGVYLLKGDGDGTLQANTTVSAGSTPLAVALGDLDGDGHLDLVSTAGSASEVWHGNGDGTFAAGVTYATGGGSSGVVISDMDGDGTPDIVTANLFSFSPGTQVSVLIGNGDGTFQPHTDFSSGSGPTWAAVGKIDGDSQPDVVTADQTDNTATVLLNTTLPPQPVGGPFTALLWTDNTTGDCPGADANGTPDGTQAGTVTIQPLDNGKLQVTLDAQNLAANDTYGISDTCHFATGYSFATDGAGAGSQTFTIDPAGQTVWVFDGVRPGFPPGATTSEGYYESTPIDLNGTPPSITPEVTGTQDGDGFYTSDVSLHWSVSDPQSPIAATSGCDDQSVTTDTAGVTYTCTATSGDGTATQSVTIKRRTIDLHVDMSATPSATVTAGDPISWTVTVTNQGATDDGAASVADAFPATVGSVTWTCAASVGSTCANASGSGDIAEAGSLVKPGGTLTYTVLATVLPAATGTVDNTATAAPGTGYLDTDASDDSAATSTTITTPAPVVPPAPPPVTPPAPDAPAIIGGPDPETGDTTATLSFQADPGDVAECSLDGGGFSACTSPARYSGLGLGPHVFAVRQISKAGKVSGAATRAWRVDVGFEPGDLGTNTKSVSALLNDKVAPANHAFGVGCELNRGSLHECDVAAYAATGKRRSGPAEIGTGRVVLDSRGQSSTVVQLVLNDLGRRLMAQNPLGLTVTVYMLGMPYDTDQTFTATQITRLRPPQIVVVPSAGMFSGDSSDLRAAGRRYVATVAKLLDDAKRVRCEGYSDSTGSERHSKAIGLERAKAVCDGLQAAGLDVPSSATSFGSSHPVASNATPAGRRRNRRVEIRVWF